MEAAPGAASFALYVGLWTVQTLLVRGAASRTGSYAFDPATMCFLIELLKLTGALLALALGAGGSAEAGACARVRRALSNAPAALPFALPSFLYVGYNLLQFLNLSLVPAPAFRTAINVKVLFTALFARALFSARLAPRQWLALLLLGLGCAVSQLDEGLQPISAGAFGLTCLQGSLSSAAGVYTQWLMQTPRARSAQALGFWEKGAYLYAWGVATNGLYLGGGGAAAEPAPICPPICAHPPTPLPRSPWPPSAAPRWSTLGPHGSPLPPAVRRDARRLLRRVRRARARDPRQWGALGLLDRAAAAAALRAGQGVCKRRRGHHDRARLARTLRDAAARHAERGGRARDRLDGALQGRGQEGEAGGGRAGGLLARAGGPAREWGKAVRW